jgi:Fe(3+) dicitrate transport protein
MVRIGLDGNRARLRDFGVFGISPKAIIDLSRGMISHTLEVGVRLHAERFRNVEIDTDRPNARPRDFDEASSGNPSHPLGSKRRNELLTAGAAAAYVQSTLSRGRFTVSPGVRVETYRQKKEERYDRTTLSPIRHVERNATTEIVPGIGGTMSLGDVAFFGGLYKGFLPSTSSTAFTALVDDEGFRVAGDLKGERSTNAELGMRGGLPGALEFNAAVFRNRVRNLIAAGRNARFEPIIGNLGEVTYQGFELSVVATLDQILRLPIAISLESSATILHSKITNGRIAEEGSDIASIEGNQAPYAPKQTVNLGLVLAPISSVHMSWTFHYVASQFADFNNTITESVAGDTGLIPEYTYVDTAIRYTIPARALSVYVTAKNLTNHIYRGSRLHRSSSGIFPGGFRQVNVGLEWRF